MATGQADLLRDWHRLFGMLLTDFFTGTPFNVEVEADLSKQQQFLDMVILRRGPGEFKGELPDGLNDLAEHNLVTFKSHHESLYDWPMKELIGHSVAYRKLVSPSPTDLLPEDKFRLYAVAARFPSKLSHQVPWRERGPGVYDCQWGTDTVRVIVAGQLPKEPRNAPLHLFSAKPELVDFGGGAYRQRSKETSSLIQQLFHRFRKEDFAMSYTMADFKRDFVKERFEEMSREERREFLQSVPIPDMQSLPLERKLAGVSEEELRQYLSQREASEQPKPRKKRGKK